MITYLFIFLLVILVMLAARYAVHFYFPSWGTVTSNALTGVGALLAMARDTVFALVPDLATLPWSSILPQHAAAMVLFACVTANMIMRKLPRKETAP